MFQIVALMLVAGMGYLAFTRDGRTALWVGWWASLLLMPVWMQFGIGSLVLDFRSIAGWTGLALLVARPPGQILPGGLRIVPADVFAVALTFTQVVTEKLVGRLGPLTGPNIVQGWLVPYLVGRVFLGTADDIPRAVAAFARLGAALSCYAMVEAVTKVNPLNRMLGKVYGLLEQGEGYRMGMKRAQGMTDHPIFFGMMLVLILPWALETSRQAKAGRGPNWWKALPWLWGGALFASISRGPQLAALMAWALGLFFRKPKWRPMLVVLALLAGAGAVVAKQAILMLSATISGEANAEEPRIILIDGEEEEYTGTRHRVLLFKVYREPLEKAGWFGYGYQMRGVQIEEDLAQRFGSIDSHYIMFYLQRGKVGVGCFVLLMASAVLPLLVLAWKNRGPRASLAGPLAGSMLMVSLGLFSVWFPSDFGSAWLFSAGLAANLSVLRDPPGAAAPQPPAASGLPSPSPAEDRSTPPACPGLRPRLAPAHAPRRPEGPGPTP